MKKNDIISLLAFMLITTTYLLVDDFELLFMWLSWVAGYFYESPIENKSQNQ